VPFSRTYPYRHIQLVRLFLMQMCGQNVFGFEQVPSHGRQGVDTSFESHIGLA
jgi:hypothetical protein